MARVFVVDDSPEIRGVLKSFLEIEGHHVVEAEDGGTFLETPSLTHDDIVLLDVMMPRVDGFEVLSKLRHLGADCPRVIMCTAKKGELDRQRSLSLGAVGFLTKPFDVDDVAEEIESVLPRSDEELSERRDHEIYLSRLLYQLERSSEQRSPAEFRP